MSTSEKLLMQIFERKRSIIDKVKNQIDLFDQELVSKLLIEGITPPSWLIGYSSSESSSSTDGRELRKEDLISKLLLPQQLPVFPYSNASLYDNKVIPGRNLEASSNGFFRETNCWNQNSDAQDGLSVKPIVDINDIGYSQDVLNHCDPIVVSPKDQMVSPSVDIDADMDHSMVRFNRSRSRQKAFELRSSAKAAAESNIQKVKSSISCSRGNGGSMIASLQLKSVDELKMVKSVEINIESDGGRDATIDEFKSEDQHLVISKTTLSGGYLELSKQRDNCLKTGRSSGVDDVGILISESADQSVPCQNHVSNFSTKEVKSSSSGKIARSRSSSLKPLHVQGSELAKPSDTNFKNVEIAEPNVSECLNKDVPLLDGKDNAEDLTIMERSILARKSFLKDGSAGSSTEGFVDTSGQQRVDNYGVSLLKPKEAVSAVSKQEVSDSEGFLMEGTSMEEASSMLVERSGDCAMEDTGILLHPVDELSNESTENVTSIGRILCERRSLLKDDHSAGSSDRKCFDMNEERLDSCGVTTLEAKQALSSLSAASNLPEHDAAVAQGCLIEEAAVENPTRMMLDRGEECTNEGTCALLHHMDKVANENTENVTSTERSTHERRSFMEEDDSTCLGDRRCSHMKEESIDNCGISPMEPNQAVSCLSAVSNLHDCDAVGSQGCLTDGTVVENISATSLDQIVECSVQGALLLHHMGEVANESAISATLIEKSKPKSRSFLEEHDSAGSIDRRCSTVNEERVDNCGISLKEPEMVIPYLSAVSNLHEQDISGSHGCLIEGSITENRNSMMLDRSEECTFKGTYTGLHHVNELQNENFEESTSIERNIRESKCYLKEEGSGGSADKRCFNMTDSSQTMPVYEGFILEPDESQLGIAEESVVFKELPLPDSSLVRASFLEQLCKSAVLNTPMSQFSTAHSMQNTMDLYQSVPNGLLEHMSFKSTSLQCENNGQLLDSSYMEDDLACGFQERSYSDGPLYARDPFGRNAKKPFASPVRKLWERRTSNSDSLKKQRSLNPELTCFTIEEDSIICEESVISEEARKTDEATAIVQENPDSRVMDTAIMRKPLADILENSGNPLASFSATQKSYDRGSLDSVNAEVQLTFSQKNVKQKPGNSFCGKRWGTSVAKENKNLSMGEDVTRDAELLPNRYSKPKVSEKTRSKREGPDVSQREAKRNNIVSNVSSFIPLVQQKQAAAAVTGKRDIKVKALEAAEAAKRLAEKKENERKMKKDLHQLELKKKQEEQKKKEVELDTRKRVREEEERKENKRKRVEESRKQPREHEKKLREKNEKETRHRPTADRCHEKKEPKNGVDKSKKTDKEIDDNNSREQLESEARLTAVLASDDTGETRVPKDHVGINDHMHMVMGNVVRKIDNESLNTKTNRERSYEISPYQGSDDEDDDDEIRRNKFVPHWASKNNLAQAVASQQHIKADVIFPPSFSANVAEALVPRMR